MRPLVLIALAASAPAHANTFVFPHLLEQSGDILTATNTFDTQLFVTYVADVSGAQSGTVDTQVDIFVFDEATGQLAESATGVVPCNPCSFQMSPTQPALTLPVDLLFDPAGGLPPGTSELYAVVETSGPGEDLVAVWGTQWSSHRAGELAGTGLRPVELPSYRSTRDGVNHVTSFSYAEPPAGSTSPQTSTVLRGLYARGLPRGPSGTVRTRLYLFDPHGQALPSATGVDVCNPCDLGTLSSGETFAIDVGDLMHAAGGAPGPIVAGTARIEAVGRDPGGLVLATEVINLRSRPGDLAIFVFEPQAIAAPAP